MYTMLSGNSRHRKGLVFYRRMSLISALIVVLSGLVYSLVVGPELEFIWDRILVVLICLLVYSIGKKETSLDRYSLLVYAVFYFVMIHSVVLTAKGDFNVYYSVGSIIIVQIYAICFRRWPQAWTFLGVWLVMLLSGLQYSSLLSDSDLLFSSIVVILIAAMSAVFAFGKDRYISDIKFRQKMLTALVNKTENSVIMTDMAGYILDANDRTCEIFGFPFEELVGKDFSVLRDKALNEEEVQFGLSQLKRDKFWNSEVRMLRKDGSSFHAYISISMLKSSDVGILVYRVRDITVTKNFEQELIQAREEAEEAVKAKGNFLATMSHEIRTPLNGVIGTASLLERTALQTEQKDYVQTILNSSQSLLVLLNDILDFSKIESGKMQLKPIACDLRNEVLSVSELLRPHAVSKNLKFAVDIDKDIPEQVVVDTMRLKQVLLNLLGNAIKFTDKGSVQLSCSIVRRLKEEIELKFIVSDTGLGISQDELSLLFQSFSQVHQSANRRYGGTGLGLAISKDLAELMGGNISVESKVGEGSTFQFTILVKSAEGQISTIKELEQIELSEEMLRILPTLNIAVAEDNRINSDVIVFMLQKLGVEPDRAYNGLELIELLSTKSYDIILMDIYMPELDGLRATKIIRKELKLNPYIIAITANSSPQDRVLCQEAGMQAFVSKPFVYSHLEKVLAEYLNSEVNTRI